MGTDSNKDYDVVDYEGNMARICAKWKYLNKNNEYEFSAKEMVEKRNINLDGGGRVDLVAVFRILCLFPAVQCENPRHKEHLEIPKEIPYCVKGRYLCNY